MDNTPRTRSSTRKRHEPTPKISERKKKLFGDESSPGTKRKIFPSSSRGIVEEDEDSDIGPMSPLQFSPSASNSSVLHGIDGSTGKEIYIFGLFPRVCGCFAEKNIRNLQDTQLFERIS